MKTKQELEQSIVMLEEQVATNKTMSAAYQQDLDLATKALADINKPVLTGLQLDNVQEAIEDAVGHFDFDDADNYNKEFELYSTIVVKLKLFVIVVCIIKVKITYSIFNGFTDIIQLSTC